MKYCYKCGKQIRPGMKFCMYCGAKVSGITANKTINHTNIKKTTSQPNVHRIKPERAKSIEPKDISNINKSETKPSPKFCKKCGKPLKPGIKFCMYCGTKVGITKVTTSSQSQVGRAPINQTITRTKAPVNKTITRTKAPVNVKPQFVKSPVNQSVGTGSKIGEPTIGTGSRQTSPHVGTGSELGHPNEGIGSTKGRPGVGTGTEHFTVNKMRTVKFNDKRTYKEPEYKVEEYNTPNFQVGTYKAEKFGVDAVFTEHDLQIFYDQRIKNEMQQVEDLVGNLRIREEFTKSDAMYFMKSFEKLEKFLDDRHFKTSAFKNRVEQLLEMKRIYSIKIFEYLTEEVKDEHLNELRKIWNIMYSKFKRKQHIVKFYQELRDINSKINRAIGRLESLLEPITNEKQFKSKLLSDHSELLVFYNNTLRFLFQNYMKLIDTYTPKEQFDEERKVLNEIINLIAPGINPQSKCSTKQINDLAYEFIAIRANNAAKISDELAELKEYTNENESKLMELREDYIQYMWYLISTNKLMINQAKRLTRQSWAEPKKEDDRIIVNPLQEFNKLENISTLKLLDELEDINEKIETVSKAEFKPLAKLQSLQE